MRELDIQARVQSNVSRRTEKHNAFKITIKDLTDVLSIGDD